MDKFKIDYPIVEIIWRDAHKQPEFVEMDDYDSDCLMSTVGYLWKVDKLFHHLSSNFVSLEETREMTHHIPNKMIISKRILRK